MRLVIIESPFSAPTPADTARNIRYARAAMLDCLNRGEAPYASHLLYTQPGVLDDTRSDQRVLGIGAGLAWGLKADATIVYIDLGFSAGMAQGVKAAQEASRPIEFRRLLNFDLTL